MSDLKQRIEQVLAVTAPSGAPDVPRGRTDAGRPQVQGWFVENAAPQGTATVSSGCSLAVRRFVRFAASERVSIGSRPPGALPRTGLFGRQA